MPIAPELLAEMRTEKDLESCLVKLAKKAKAANNTSTKKGKSNSAPKPKKKTQSGGECKLTLGFKNPGLRSSD